MEYTIIDVREPEEFNLGHLEGAVNVPSQSLMTDAPELKNVPKDARLLIYCRTGSRSKLAIDLFKQMGYTDLTNGINQYIAKERFGLK